MLTGIFLAVAGICMTGYFFLYFSITAPGSSTINIGLMSDRQNGIIVGIALMVLGIACAICVKVFSKEPTKLVGSELRVYGLVVAGFLGLCMLSMIGSQVTEWWQTASAQWAESMRPKTASTPANDRSFAANASSGNYVTTPVNQNAPNINLAATGAPVSLPKEIPPTYRDWRTTKPTPAEPDSSKLTELKDKNAAIRAKLSDMIQLRQQQAQLNQRLQQRLTELNNEIQLQRNSINRLQNNQEISDQVISKQNHEIGDLTSALGQKHQDESPASQLPVATNLQPTGNDIVDTWMNVPDFYPSKYKADLFRRLQRVGDRRLSPPLARISTNAAVHFVIEKDGHPTSIEILKISNDDEDCRKRLIEYIKAAGPFRPLLSSKLMALDVDANVSDEANSDLVRVNQVRIAALGNKSDLPP